MQRFKNVLVAKNSDLADALAKGDRKLAEKLYAATSERFKKLYGEEDSRWFEKFLPF